MKTGTWSAYVGAITGGVLASACCLGPLVVGVLGVGSAGFASAFEPYRPYMLALTVMLLGGAFFMTYRKRTAAACAKDGSCSTSGPSRRQQGMLWTITVITLAAASYPYWISAGTNSVSATEAKQGTVVELAITGMTCDSCANRVQKTLSGVPGVSGSTVTFDDGKALVTVEENVSPSVLVAAVEGLGFGATSISPPAPNELVDLAVVLDIKGMTCNGCSVNVQKALQKVPGVESVEVSYEAGQARLLLAEPVADKELTQAIAAIGYSAVVSPKDTEGKKEAADCTKQG